MRQLEHTSFVIGIRDNKEDILKNRDEELAEEEVARRRVRLCHVIHKLDTHGETGCLDLSIVVFARPHARVDDELELSLVQLKKSWEAIEVDGLQKLKETDPVFWVLVEVLVNHAQSAFENALHDDRDFVLHEALQSVSGTFKKL